MGGGASVGDSAVPRLRREALHSMFRAAAMATDERSMDVCLKTYGQQVTTAVGDEVDRLELMIMELEPSIKHVDLETN